MLGEFGFGSTNDLLIDIFLHSPYLSSWYYLDIVRRNSVMVTRGSKRVKNLLREEVEGGRNGGLGNKTLVIDKHDKTLKRFWQSIIILFWQNSYAGIDNTLMLFIVGFRTITSTNTKSLHDLWQTIVNKANQFALLTMDRLIMAWPMTS